MPQLKYILFLLTFSIVIISCKKGDTGPQGPTGEQGSTGIQGPRGPQGVTGNANVIMYTYNGPFSLTLGIDLVLTKITKGRIDSSLVLAYYIPASYPNNWYPIPGVGGYGTLVQFQTIYDLHPGTGNNFVFALRLFNAGFTAYNGSTVVFNKIKVIVAPAATIVPAGRQSGGSSKIPPEVDFSDYHAVVKYFNIAE